MKAKASRQRPEEQEDLKRRKRGVQERPRKWHGEFGAGTKECVEEQRGTKLKGEAGTPRGILPKGQVR